MPFAGVRGGELWRDDAFALADGKEGLPERTANILTVAAGASWWKEVEGANEVTGGAAEGELSGPGEVLSRVGNLVGWDQLLPCIQLLNTIVGVDAIVMPSGPITTIRVTRSFVGGVAEEEVAAVHGAQLRVNVIGGRFGLYKIPTGAESALRGVLDEEETVCAGGEGSSKGGGRGGHSKGQLW